MRSSPSLTPSLAFSSRSLCERVGVRAFPAATCRHLAPKPLNLPRQSEQDADVTLFHLGAAEQAPEGEHDVVGIVAMQKADRQESRLQPLKHHLDPLRRREHLRRAAVLSAARNSS